MASTFDEEVARRAREAVQPDMAKTPDLVKQPMPDETLIRTHPQDVQDWNRDRTAPAAQEQEQVPASKYEELVKQYRSTGNHEHERDIKHDRDFDR
jgi:hypothetical protein